MLFLLSLGFFFLRVKNVLANEILFVHIEYGENQSFIFNYELITNTSYYLTLRLFEHEQLNFGLFSGEVHSGTFAISNRYKSSNDLFYLFIICFHFLHEHHELDIQCKDLRLSPTDLMKSPLPSYKPLFVPLMYALSVLMLLPVIIQHRRHKHAEILKRRKQIRRLSMTIVQENPKILTNLVLNSNSHQPTELLSFPSTKTMLDDIDEDENESITFTLANPAAYDEELPITADDCVAHLLDSTPWSTKHDPIKPKLLPHNIDDEQQPILKPNSHCAITLYRANPAFLETDV